MLRWLAAGAAAILFAAAAISFLSADRSRAALPAAPPAAPAAATEIALPEPAAIPRNSPEQREAKRLARYDRDRDGSVSMDEYLRSRQRAFAKLDTNGDGSVSFAEYSAKAAGKFAGADKDRSKALSATEFATTAVVRKAAAKPARCPPTAEADD